MRPAVSIGLNDREKFLLIKLNKFFEEIGSVYETPNHNFAEWKVFKLTSFNSLITHFNNYPLKGFKFYNFSIWYEIVKLLVPPPDTPPLTYLFPFPNTSFPLSSVEERGKDRQRKGEKRYPGMEGGRGPAGPHRGPPAGK